MFLVLKYFLRSVDPPKFFDAGIRNEWNWSWLSWTDRKDDLLSGYCVKIDKSGYTHCAYGVTSKMFMAVEGRSILWKIVPKRNI